MAGREAKGSPGVDSRCRAPQANFSPGDRTRGAVTQICSLVQEEDPRSGRGEGQSSCHLWGASCGRARPVCVLLLTATLSQGAQRSRVTDETPEAHRGWQ